MKLRFRNNSLRLRINQREVAVLANGQELRERVQFPNGADLIYRIVPAGAMTSAEFSDGVITVFLPAETVQSWESSDEIGLYGRAKDLDIAIEKDLECVDAPAEEKDPFAYPRKSAC
jgi:hypothetical protein